MRLTNRQNEILARIAKFGGTFESGVGYHVGTDPLYSSKVSARTIDAMVRAGAVRIDVKTCSKIQNYVFSNLVAA
jgi:hypothetical protein